MKYYPEIWFNPAYLIQCGIDARKKAYADNKKLPGDVDKAIHETLGTSIWALANHLKTGIEQYVQMVDPRDQAPDARILFQHPTDTQGGLPMANYWDVEVVTYGEHTNMPIPDFLKKTKLSPKKSYQDGTIILCLLDKTVTGGMSWPDIYKALKDIKSNLQVILVGRIDPVNYIFATARVYPSYDSVMTIDLHDAKNEYKNRSGVMVYNMGRTARPPRPDVPKNGYNPFIAN